MKRPHGLTDFHMLPIVELNKTIYGLHKAFKYFVEFLTAELMKLDLVRTISDQQIFLLRHDRDIFYLSTHVDDLFVAYTRDSYLPDWVRDKLL